MAAAKLSLPPGSSVDGSLGSPVLLETMQLVEPRKPIHVPNHLLESRIYSKIAQNSVVQARPAVLHFGGFELHKTHTQTLQLANISTEVQRMHIIPPQTKYFYIKYTKRERLVAGLTLDCEVEFTPNEWRYYYDCIRIHTKGEENLVIPIHAYPVMSTADFPDHVTFPAVPVGHSLTKSIPLRCGAPIDFEFELTIPQPHPAFTVDPMKGVVPASGEVEISITYSPTEFNTAVMRLQLLVSQFNATPLVCQVTGYSAPGLARELTEKTEISLQESVLDPRCVSPLDVARQRRKQKGCQALSLPAPPEPVEVMRNGVRFPQNLDTPHAVAQVLNQEPGKLKMKDLRQVMLAKKDSSVGVSRQMKEAMFEQAVRQDVYEERQNQLRWQVKLGADVMSTQQKQNIVNQRGEAWHKYKANRGDPIEEEELSRSCTHCNFRRTFRDSSQIGQEGVQFDMYTNDPWAARHSALSKFAQAARKIIIRRRADCKIDSLKQTLLDWGNKKYKSTISAEEKDQKQDEEEQVALLDDLALTPAKVKSVTFPTYTAPSHKDDMAVDALGVVPYKPTEVIVKTKVPYFPLKVPKQYELVGYRPHSVHEASSGYVPPNLSRPLRTGAQEEVIELPLPTMVTAEPVHVDTQEVPAPELEQPQHEVVQLKPPEALFRPIDYPPLHIFNATPGLQVFQAPMPYAEVDPDFHLCPLPRYTSTDISNPHMATQRKYLDREEIIRGVMTWKKFPSQGLTSLANTPTLTSVWAPRWTDPFGSELLPGEVPPLYDGLPQEELENIVQDDSEEAGLQLTPEMVSAQFSLVETEGSTDSEKQNKEEMFPHGNKMPATNLPVSSHGPVPREKREQELDYFLKKKYNKLGGKIQQRVEQMDVLKTNPDLVLK